jgi:hypothetical protein
MALDATRVIHGDYGKLFIGEEWQTNVDEVDAKVANQKVELSLSGSDYIQHKRGKNKGTGSMGYFHVTSAMAKRGFAKFDMIVVLADPEAWGFERVRLKNCMFDEITIAGFKIGDLVKRTVNFTFEGHEWLDEITAT